MFRRVIYTGASMAEITILPPQKEPSKPTAQVRPESLGEHMRAFMNKNNAGGFIADEDNELSPDTIGGVLLEVAFGPGMTVREIVNLVKQLRVMSNRQMSERLARHVVMQALGYKDMSHAEVVNGGVKFGDFIKNIADNNLVQQMYERRHAGVKRPTSPTSAPRDEVQMRQPQSLMTKALFDQTDSVRNVTVVGATRLSGNEVAVKSTPAYNTSILSVKKIAVTLEDGDKFDLLVDLERLAIGVGTLPEHNLDLEIGVSLCNHNLRFPEPTSASRSLVFASSGLRETEYFNRKMRIYAAN
jgi:hypothetical protein